jgi:hypothetical protein
MQVLEAALPDRVAAMNRARRVLDLWLPSFYRKRHQWFIGYAQHESPCWIGGHFTSPYEQYTQQSPAFGLSNASQLLQS